MADDTTSRHYFPSHGSAEMAVRINSFDWQATALGPISTWPTNLRTALGILLGSRFPMQLLWGPEYIHFYNDAYIPIAADKHPGALGCSGAQIWPEIWALVLPMLEQVRATGEPTWADDQLLVLNRHGMLEECYFTFSYSSIQGGRGQSGGVFVAVAETTHRVLSVRRMQGLRDLGVAMAGVTDEAAVCAAIEATLVRIAADLPFALLYLPDEQGHFRRSCAVTIADDHPLAPEQIALTSDAPWPLAAALAAFEPSECAIVEASQPVPAGPWDVSPRAALLVPLRSAQSPAPLGVLVAGLSARLHLDNDYRAFLAQIASQIASALAVARSYAATTAALRLRDDFLSIAAHELKNPLTPIIGRLQLLRKRLEEENAAARHIQSLHTVLADAQRITDLIDSLLDVSRLRDGQLTITRARIDLRELVQRLSAALQPSLEDYTIAANVPAAPVVIDGDALRLEQVVRNLVSNAVKYSPPGGTIMLALKASPTHALLSVSDQGMGIAPDELPHVFESYYRGGSADVRSIGGIGVGLFVVQEIVRHHDGTIQAQSALGKGSTFTVALPLAGA